jgi:hypothetical protein
MENDLLFLSGNDIPFIEAQVIIHQPTLKEIAYIGERDFFIGCGFLDFSKNLLNEKDKINLENYSDFDILMSIMIKRNPETIATIDAAYKVLTLIFPLYDIEVRNSVIVLKRDGQEFYLTRANFSIFKEILSDMFCLNLGKKKDDFNPAGDMSSKIAEKLKKRHEQLARIKGMKISEKRIAILSHYVSILAIGCQLSLNDLMDYTVYQLYDEFQRYQLKVQWDAYVQAKMAGAKNLDDVDNWMIDLREQGKNKK